MASIQQSPKELVKIIRNYKEIELKRFWEEISKVPDMLEDFEDIVFSLKTRKEKTRSYNDRK